MNKEAIRYHLENEANYEYEEVVGGFVLYTTSLSSSTLITIGSCDGSIQFDPHYAEMRVEDDE